MKLKQLTAACTVALATMFGGAGSAQAQISGDVIKIGIITDISGLYSDIDGNAGVEMIRAAVADMGGESTARRSRSSTPTIRTSPTSPRPRPASGSTRKAWTC